MKKSTAEKLLSEEISKIGVRDSEDVVAQHVIWFLENKIKMLPPYRPDKHEEAFLLDCTIADVYDTTCVWEDEDEKA